MCSEVANTAHKSAHQIGARSLARLNVIQALYQMDIVGSSVEDVIADSGIYNWNQLNGDENMSTLLPDMVFFQDIVRGVVCEQRDLDPIIDHHLADGWRLTRIDSTLRAILRAGSYELCYRMDVPVRVVIDEYVELAHDFFDSKEVSTANGILDMIARTYRAGELSGSSPLHAERS